MLTLVFLLILSGVVAYGLYRASAIFAMSEGTIWDRLLATSKESATLLWSKVLALAGTLISWAALLSEYLNLPEVQHFITAVLKPEHVGIALIVIAGVTAAARLRSLFS